MLSKVCVKQALNNAVTRKFSARVYPSYILSSPQTDVSRTSNGIRVASETAHGGTATISVFVDAGSRNETEKNNGASHFLTKLAFKGTKSRSQSQLENEIGNIGGQITAKTSREQTVYTAKVLKSNIPKAMELMADILQNPTLDEAAITAERDVISAESEAIRKTNELSIWDHLHETAFMGTGLSRTVRGPEENIRTLDKAELQKFISSQFSADRFVIAAAGAVDHSQLVELTEKHFGKLPQHPAGAVAIHYDAAIFTGSDKRIRFDSMGLAHVALAFQGAALTSEHAFPLMLMQSVLGSWDRTSPIGVNAASKFAQEVADHKLAHNYETFNTQYKDTGLFGIYVVCKDSNCEDAMWYALDNLVRCCHNVSDGEVARAKIHLKSKLMMQQDSHSSTSDFIGRQMLSYGRRISNAELFARIDGITTSDLKATASKFINDEDHALAAIGPIFELPDYNWIRRRSYWHRY